MKPIVKGDWDGFFTFGLDAMLAKVSDTYDTLVDNSIDRFTALLPPILLLFVSGLVVTIILSIILPLMSLTTAL